MQKPTEQTAGMQDQAPCPACARVMSLATTRLFEAIAFRATSAELSRASRLRRKASECFDACCARQVGAPCPVQPWFVCPVCAAALVAATVARRMARARAAEALRPKYYRAEYDSELRRATDAEDSELAQATLAAEECARGACRNPQTFPANLPPAELAEARKGAK